MSHSNKSRALKKIAKCLELGNSNNANEAAQAIKMAHRLMLKYGLQADDIEFIKMGKTISKVLLPALISNNILRLIRGLNTRFGVECVLTNHKGLKKAEFIGGADKAIFAAFAFDIVYRDMNQQVAKFKNTFAGTGTSNTTVARRVHSFARGWVQGALEKLPDLTTNNPEDLKITSYIDKEFENIDRESLKRQLKDAMGKITADYEEGLKKGHEVRVNRPISGAQRAKELALKK